MMKHKIATLLAACLIGSGMIAQGIDFFHGTWDEALNEAEKEGKIIFVDAYTTWCGPCKRMASQVFPRSEVGDFYNANFINMKLDMERGEGLKFRDKYPVQAFPTFFYIDPDGKVLYKIKGARQPAAFIAEGKKAVKRYDGSAQYAKRYAEGDRSYELVYNYVTALNKSGKSSLKVANEYLRGQDDLTTQDNLKLILEAATQADSKIFDYLIENKKSIEKIAGKNAVTEKIMQASKATAHKGVEYESTDLLAQAQQVVETHVPTQAESFRLMTNMDYASMYENVDEYVKNAKPYVKKHVQDNPQKLHNISTTILDKFHDSDSAMAIAEKAAQRALEIKVTDNYTGIYATVLYLRGNKSKALSVLNAAITQARANAKSTDKLRKLKKQFQES